MSQFDHLKLSFSKMEKLLVFRQILHDNMLQRIRSLIMSLDRYMYDEHSGTFYQICYELINIAEENGYQGDLLQNYFMKLIATDRNPFTMECERSGYNINPSLYQAAIHDLAILKEVYKFTLTDIGIIIGVGELSFISHYSSTPHTKYKNPLQKNFRELKQSFAKENAEHIVETLASYYNRCGCGKLCQYSSFRWNDELVGISECGKIRFDDIIGYERQKEELIENTVIFLEGKQANNVLLYGDSGTGKSSSVKALISKYSNHGLRLVEITKDQIKCIPQILDMLKERGLYFIIFMDDLSFEDFETDYKYLKAIMEGGIEGKPDNVIFYATTNRKHIVKEKWQDRNTAEIHKSDAEQEKLSLSERFGITITYQSPSQQQYLEIVKRLAVKSNLYVPEQELIEQALKWEKWHHGRSGRTARQFINYLCGKFVS
ncbi:MAG: ATP-binding protein [bacterium]